MTPRDISVVLLSAGYARRMGFFKPLEPLDGVSSIERLLGTCSEAGIEDIIVITGHRSPDVTPCVLRWGGRPVYNTRFAEGMWTSVQTGAASLSPSSRAFFILPADMPLVRKTTLLQLIGRADPERIVSPTFEGVSGHPPLIGSSHIPSLLSFEADGGLRQFIESKERWVARLPVADEGILLDMNYPEDFERLGRRAKRLDIPTPAERRALLSIAGTPERVVRHCEMVASVAVRLAMGLSRRRPDIPLLRAAALLHDIRKTAERHDIASGSFLREHGFPSLAEIVASHMDLHPNPSVEQALLYLADKMTDGTEVISLEQKRALMKKRFAGDSVAWRSARRRLARARRIARTVERLSGQGISSLLPSRSSTGSCLR